MHDSELVTFRRIPTGYRDFIIGRTRRGELHTCWSHLGGYTIAPDGIEDPTLDPALADALTAYFAGKTDGLPLPPIPSKPPFFSACWHACVAIPRGASTSYQDLATTAGSPTASRAAGQAMKTNPLAVLVPCHRVKARDGEGGYAGSTHSTSLEMETKRFLLELEQNASSRTLSCQLVNA
jgi:O-6-methylguanine DNA methyltransferase